MPCLPQKRDHVCIMFDLSEAVNCVITDKLTMMRRQSSGRSLSNQNKETVDTAKKTQITRVKLRSTISY